jgi:hypothetical protein
VCVSVGPWGRSFLVCGEWMDEWRRPRLECSQNGVSKTIAVNRRSSVGMASDSCMHHSRHERTDANDTTKDAHTHTSITLQAGCSIGLPSRHTRYSQCACSSSRSISSVSVLRSSTCHSATCFLQPPPFSSKPSHAPGVVFSSPLLVPSPAVSVVHPAPAVPPPACAQVATPTSSLTQLLPPGFCLDRPPARHTSFAPFAQQVPAMSCTL